jgi:hypothetical protein
MRAAPEHESQQRQPGYEQNGRPSQYPSGTGRKSDKTEDVTPDLEMCQSPDGADDRKAEFQWAIPPPGALLFLCMSNNNGNASTNAAPNNRNSCSNDSISA